MRKASQKQTKTIKDQGEKQINALEGLKTKGNIEKQIQAIEDRSDDHDDKLSYKKLFLINFQPKEWVKYKSRVKNLSLMI